VDCKLCGGKCGSEWTRATIDSHDFAKAQWIGCCELPQNEQQQIKEQRIRDYEQERTRGSTTNSGFSQRFSSGKASKGIVAIFIILGASLARNSDNVFRFLRRNSDEAVELGSDFLTSIPKSQTEEVATGIGKMGARYGARKATGHVGRSDKDGRSDEAQAPSYSDSTALSGRFFIRASRESFSMRNEGYYELDGLNTDALVEYHRNGDMRTSTKNTVSILPDASQGEFQYRELVHHGDRDFRITVHGQVSHAEGAMFQYSSEADVEFISGNYQQYAEGNTVVIGYTELGLRESISAAEDQACLQIKKAIRQQFDGSAKVVVKVRASNIPKETITVNLKTMVTTSSTPLEIEFDSTVYW